MLHLGPGPKELKLQLYNIQSKVLEELATEVNATFIGTTADVLDDEGFLAPDFYNDDPTHGNSAYGAIVLERILQQARGNP